MTAENFQNFKFYRICNVYFTLNYLLSFLCSTASLIYSQAFKIYFTIITVTSISISSNKCSYTSSVIIYCFIFASWISWQSIRTKAILFVKKFLWDYSFTTHNVFKISWIRFDQKANPIFTLDLSNEKLAPYPLFLHFKTLLRAIKTTENTCIPVKLSFQA